MLIDGAQPLGLPPGGNQVLVLLPDDYDHVTPLPVVFLLHGVSDDHTTWVKNTDVEDFARGIDAIIVAPNGGSGSKAGWYSDWKSGPQWETFHTDVLRKWVDDNFATTGSRGVVGASMGGFGALSYAARHAKLFGAAASISGFLDTQMFAPADGYGFWALGNPTGQGPSLGTPQRDVWGDPVLEEENWAEHNPAALAANGGYNHLFKRRAIWIRTGTAQPDTEKAPNAWFDPNPDGYPLEYYIWRSNQSFRQKTPPSLWAQHEEVYAEANHPHDWPYHELHLHEVLLKVIEAIDRD